jgi:hypothetical protein
MRPEPHADEHYRSARTKGDRIATKPKGLRALLRWAQREWSLETPGRLHNRDTADDGAPDFTPETKSFLGMATHGDIADDWRNIACRTTEGYYATPLHCVVAGLSDPERAYVRDLLTDLYHPEDIADIHGLPRWAHERVARDLLSGLYDRYRDMPMPRRVNRSESQLDADAAA